MSNEVQINKAEIRALIPHAGLMCLLDSVIQWDDRSIVCISHTHRDAANPLRREGCLSAVHGGLRAREMGETAPPGYLAALRDAHLYVQRLDDIDSALQIFASRLFG